MEVQLPRAVRSTKIMSYHTTSKKLKMGCIQTATFSYFLF